MFKKTRKIDKEDLGELQARLQMINQYKLVVQALEAQKDHWLVSKYFKYGLDASREYTFNLNTGEIKDLMQPDRNSPDEKGGGF